MSNAPLRTDVFVVGGGPAGLAAAIAARRKGFRVAVADCSQAPIDKACGEGLMPEAVSSLARLGIPIGGNDGYPFAGIRFVDGARSVQAAFPGGFGVGLRRTILHRMMVERATEAGVAIYWGTRVDSTSGGELAMDGSPVRSHWIIGADGHNSRVRRWAGLDRERRQHTRFGFRRHFRIQPWSDCVEVHWGPGCQVFTSPVAPTEVGLAVLTRDPRMRLEDALDRFPEIKARLKDAPTTTRERGSVTAMLSLKSVYRDHVALIGDASGSVDAITGEGLSLAFQQAERLADALASNNLELYQAEHRRIMRLPMFMSRLMLSMDSRHRLRHGVMRLFEAQPRIFSMFLAAHVGGLTLWRKSQTISNDEKAKFQIAIGSR